MARSLSRSSADEACLRLRNCYFIGQHPAPAPHLAHPEGCAVRNIALVTVPRVSRSCEHFPGGLDLHLPLFAVEHLECPLPSETGTT